MTGSELKNACQKLLESIGNGGENPDFITALRFIAFDTQPKRLEFMAKYPRLEDALWLEIENHINHYPIENDELFEYAIALLEHGWTKGGQAQ